MPEHSQAIDHVAASQSDAQHNVFIGLTGEVKSRVFCLPDNYEVFDASMNDIKFNLQPVFSTELIAKLDEQKWEEAIAYYKNAKLYLLFYTKQIQLF